MRKIPRETILHFYNKGYHVDPDGTLRGPEGRVCKPIMGRGGYHIYHNQVRNHPIHGHWRPSAAIHRIAAYQLFGEAVFDPNLYVRHLDGNPLNNALSNLLMGTASQNRMDMPPEKRRAGALAAAKHLRRFSVSDVREMRSMRARGETYVAIGLRFGIGKGHAHTLVNEKFYRDA